MMPRKIVVVALAAVIALAALVWLWMWPAENDQENDAHVFSRTTGENTDEGDLPVSDNLAVDNVRVFARTTGEHAGEEDMSASGDFNGDGALDMAFFVRVSEGYGLAVALDATDLVQIAELDSIARMGIANAPPGTYIAACAKGYGDDCAEGELRELTTTHDSIKLFQYESSSVLYVLQGETFKKMWLSD